MGDLTVHALRGVNCTLEEGELVVLLGPSGSGKSTLFNILGGLDRASSGEVYYQDEALHLYDEKALTQFRRKNVGFVFQFYNLIPNLTALENVELVAELAPKPMSSKEALELLGLKDRFHHFPSQLSGGEQQRVAIARAIVKRPHILLCDEPTGALDYPTGKIVLSALEKVNLEFKTSTFIITHNSAISQLADRVLYLADGKICQEKKNKERSSVQDIQW